MLVCLTGSPWQQTQALLRTLRGDHLPFFIPIVIVTQTPPNSDTLLTTYCGTPGLGLMYTGAVISMNDMTKAGLMRARCIMLYAGLPSEMGVSDRRMIDGAVVTMLAAIEGALCEQQDGSAQIVVELHRVDSVKFMHRFPLNEDNYLSGGKQWSFNPNESFENHPRFASGNICTAAALGSLLAKSFYTPGIVELIQFLCLHEGCGEDAYPWQVAVPQSFLGKTYGDLAEDFGKPGQGALCLGLFRLCFPETGSSAGYVLTNPTPSTVLRPSDLVSVVAPAAFGKACFEKGMVIGAAGALKATLEAEEVAADPGQNNETTMHFIYEDDGVNAGPHFARGGGSSSEKLPLLWDAAEPSESVAAGPDDGVKGGSAASALGTEDGASSEVHLPPELLQLHKELTMIKLELQESKARGASLRAELRACASPLAADSQTPRRVVGNAG